MHKVGVLFLSCGHSPHQRAMWRRKWSTTERLRPHCCSRRPPSSRRLVECGAKRGRSLSLAAPFLFHAALSARSAAVSGFSSGVGWQLSLHSNSLNVCGRFRLRFKLHSAGRWDRLSPSSSLSAQFSLSNSSLAVTSSEVSQFCEPSSSFARRGAFFEELAVSSQKLRGSGRNLHLFLPKVWRCFPPLRLFSAQRVAMCKKIPRCLSDSGGMSFAARTAGCVARRGFSIWRRWGAIA